MIRRPPTVALKLSQVASEGQHVSPGKHLQDLTFAAPEAATTGHTARTTKAAVRKGRFIIDRAKGNVRVKNTQKPHVANLARFIR